MADSEDASGRHKLEMVLEPELSNLTASPDWPILVANLVRWRLAQTPGPAASNVRLGSDAASHAARRRSLGRQCRGHACPAAPSNRCRSTASNWKCIRISIGLYNVRAGSMQFPFACNALNADESNLADCASGQWGNWNDSEVFQDQRVSLDWAFILVAPGMPDG